MYYSKWLRVCLLVLIISLLVSGCGKKQAGSPNQPIEPITPEEELGEAGALLGRFAIKSADVQILDLSVSADGSLAAVGSASRTVYLLEQDGKLRWEKPLKTVPLKTYVDPSGKYVAVGTYGGKLYLLGSDQAVRFELDLGQPVVVLSVSGDGETILAGLQASIPGETERVVLLDKMGRCFWELEVEHLLDAIITGADNHVVINWQEGEDMILGSFTAEGKPIWEKRGRKLFALSGQGRLLASTQGNEVLCYDESGNELWSYTTAGAVSKLLFARDGLFLGVLVRDEATQQEEFLYLDTHGELLWSKRLPDDSHLLVSPDGTRVIVASWRQYRDDATQVWVYNQRGQEVNVLEVAGRVQRMALSDQAATLVLGLEDGSIFFLNIDNSNLVKSEPLSSIIKEKTLQDYYRPVDFGRDEGESRLSLFFYDESAQFLIPVTRRIKRTQMLLGASIEELIRGPVQGSYLQRTIPKEAQVSASLNDGNVLIDLNPTLDGMSGTTFLTGILDSLLLTVSQFPTIEQIHFTVGGESKETFGSEGLLINEGFIPRRFGRQVSEHLLFIPYRSGERFYLLPISKETLPLKDKALIEVLVQHVLHEGVLFFPPDTRLEGVRIAGGTVYLDFNTSFGKLTNKNNAEAAAKAALLRDALALSIVENLPFSTVQFTVGGKPLDPPPEFLPWEMTISRPYYINLED